MTIRYAMLFDMDGTLLQTEKLALPAFRQTFEDLRDRNLWEGHTPTEDQLTNVLGMTLNDLWNTLLPETDAETRKIADQRMLDNEMKLLKQGVTDLYPGVRQVLTDLHNAGITLFVASNGLEKYIDAICDHFEIKGLFTDLYSAGRFQTKSKNDLVAKLLTQYQISPVNACMVGDRRSDVEAGKTNRLFTIGCDFGFAKTGELDGADVIVREFSEIVQHLPNTLQK